jgi:Tol biopolymer transport system component
MSPIEWEQLQKIAGEALDLDPAQRKAYLDRVCGADATTRERVSALIEASDRAEEFFGEAVGEMAGDVLANLPWSRGLGEPIRVWGLRIESGQKIGRYVVTGMLGRGGMGDAFSAEDTELGRPVVLKFLRQAGEDSGSDDAANSERQIHEAKAASALNHPNIVTVYEVLRTEHGTAIVMEFVAGEVLRVLCGQAQPVDKVLRVGEQMAEALAAASAANIVHRDVKPENVIVRPDGYIKILDFGLARQLDAKTISHPGLPAGSYRYMSPEQARGQKITGASDVFSMGTVLFELLAGSHPYPAETALQAMMAIGTGEPKVLTDVIPAAPRELSDLLAQMMARDPAARPRANEVVRRLREIREDSSRPGEAKPPTAERGRWFATRNRIAAALTTVGIGAGLWWGLSSHRARAGHGGDELLEPVLFARGATHAAISRDGSKIAYQCDFKGLKQICVATNASKVETFGKPGAASDNPAWSPDGNTLAYLSATGVEEAEVILREVSGDAERTLAVIGTLGSYSSALCWSPHLASLIVSANLTAQDSFGLFLLSTSTGELRRLTTPQALGRPFGDSGPAVSPDGRWLAFNRVKAEGLADLYILELDAKLTPMGEPRKLDTGGPWNVTPAWTADGQDLVFSSGTFRRHRLVRMAVFERDQPRPIAISMAGSAAWPMIGKDSLGRPLLLFTSSINITNIWEAELGRAAPPARQVTTPANSRDFQPSYATDGRRFAFISDRSGYEEVWVDEVDGGNPVQRTTMRCSKVAIPRWSPDNTRITFSAVCGGQSDIYTVGGPSEKPLRLTDSRGLNENSRWFPGDGWIYFTSFRTGVSVTWKVPDTGGQAVPLTSRMTSNPQFSRDGRTMYFTRLSEGKLALWKTPADRAADEELVLTDIDDYIVARSGVYFTTSEQGEEKVIRFLSFGSPKILTAAVLPQHPVYVFDVSNDEKKLIFAREYLSTEDLERVDGFQ